ncbi:arginine N-succinyltransferase, partial [Acinetobacter baumannii]
MQLLVGIGFGGTVAKLAMRQPFVLFKGLTFQKLCL